MDELSELRVYARRDVPHREPEVENMAPQCGSQLMIPMRTGSHPKAKRPSRSTRRSRSRACKAIFPELRGRICYVEGGSALAPRSRSQEISAARPVSDPDAAASGVFLA